MAKYLEIGTTLVVYTYDFIFSFDRFIKLVEKMADGQLKYSVTFVNERQVDQLR
jgi:hypothetical protein